MRDQKLYLRMILIKMLPLLTHQLLHELIIIHSNQTHQLLHELIIIHSNQLVVAH